MGRHYIETIMGAVVLLVAGFFLHFAYSQADIGAVKGYRLSAAFANVGGLPNGADVRVNGIKIGTVIDQKIDATSFMAEISISIRPDIHLPKDTVAVIDTDGLLGGKILALLPGKSQELIPEGGRIEKTQNYRALEEMVGDIIFLAGDGDKK